MTIPPRLARALGAAGVCFAVGTTASILMGVPWLVPGILTSTTVAVFVWRSTANPDGVRARPTVNQQQLAWRLVAAVLVGVAVVFWSTSFVLGLLIAAVVFAVLVLLGRLRKTENRE